MAPHSTVPIRLGAPLSQSPLMGPLLSIYGTQQFRPLGTHKQLTASPLILSPVKINSSLTSSSKATLRPNEQVTTKASPLCGHKPAPSMLPGSWFRGRFLGPSPGGMGKKPYCTQCLRSMMQVFVTPCSGRQQLQDDDPGQDRRT